MKTGLYIMYVCIYIYIYIHMYNNISLSLSLYIYIYIYTHIMVKATQRPRQVAGAGLSGPGRAFQGALNNKLV